MDIKLSQISNESLFKNTIAAKICEFEEKKKATGEKYGVYLLKQQQSKITAIAWAETYTLLRNVLKVDDDKLIRFPPGTFSCQRRIMKYRTHSTSKYDLTFRSASAFIRETKFATPDPSVVESASTDDYCTSLHKLSQFKPTETLKKRLKAIKFSGGVVHRYWGCEVCNFSIRTRHSDGEYYCKGIMCNKKKTAKRKIGVPRKRKICFTINNVIISNDKDEKIESVVIFNRVCESLLKKCGNDFDTDNEAETAWQELITSFCFHITLQRNKKKVGSAFTPAIFVEMVEETRVPFSTRTEPEPVVVEPVSNVESESDGGVSDLEPTIDNGNEFSGAKKKRVKIPNFADYEMKLEFRSDKRADYVTKYRITSRPRGMVLLINNYNYPDCDFTERRGSEKDIDKLQEGFGIMGYEIYGNKCHMDIKTRMEFGNLIENFKRELIRRNVDSMFVVISSHGRNNQVVLMNANENVCVVEDLLIPFSDVKFPGFQGKPKVFIPLACQTLRNTASDKPLDFLCNKLFDMLVCCPCLPGYAQKRYPPVHGSLFVNYLMKKMMKYGTSWHLVEILDEVQEDFKKEIRARQLTTITVPHYIKSTFGEFRVADNNTEDMNMEIDESS